MRMMWKKPAAWLIAAACVFSAVQTAQAQVAVVTVQSIDAVMSDIKYILKVGGKEDLGAQLEGLLGALSPDGKPFAGLDTKRPLGLYANMPKEGAEPAAVGFIPISKEATFLELLTKFNIPHEKGEKDVYKVTPPQGQPFFLRFANEHAYISNQAENLHGKLAVPATLIPASHKGSLLAATIRLDQIPQNLKDMALSQLEQQIESEKSKKPGESDAEHQGRVAVLKLTRDAAASVIAESKELTFSFQIDQKANNLALDLALSAKPGSQLASSFKSFGASRSMFSSLVKDSALNFLASAPIPAELQSTLVKVYDQATEEALKNAKSDAERDMARKLITALKPTIKSEAIDLGVVVYGPSTDEKYSVVGGLAVKEGKNLEKAFLDALKHVPDSDKKNIKLNVDKVGDVNIHMIRPEETPNEDVKKHLGSTDIHVAMMDNAVLFGVGQNGKQALKDAMAGLKSGKDAATAPVQFEASVARLAPLAKDEDAEKFREAAKKLFTGANKNRDRVRISVQGGETLRLRFDAHAELIKLVFELVPLPGG